MDYYLFSSKKGLSFDISQRVVYEHTPIVCENNTISQLKSYSHFVGQVDELCDGELFRASRQERSMICEERRLCWQQLSEGNAQHLPPLAKDRLHHTAEQLLITAKVSHRVTCHANHGTLHLGGRIEYVGLYGKQIIHVIPCLDEDG